MAVRIKCVCDKILVVKGDRIPESVRCPNCGKVRNVPKPAIGPKPRRTALDRLEAPAAPRSAEFRCRDCGAVFRRKQATAGGKCRICGSQNVGAAERKPPEPAGLDLAPAGLTPQDKRFGRLALWTGCVSERALEGARDEQLARAQRGERTSSICALLRSRGEIRESDYRVILKLLDRPSRSVDERVFCELARDRRIVAGTQLRECRRVQAAHKVQGDAMPRLEDLLIDRGYVGEAQVGQILEHMRRQNKGLLAEFDRLRVAGRSGLWRWVGGFRARGWRSNPLVGAAAVLIALIVLFRSVKSLSAGREVERPVVEMQCRGKGCRRRDSVPDPGAPATCSFCERETLYYLAPCPHCRKRFTFSAEDLRQGLRCPHCGRRGDGR